MTRGIVSACLSAALVGLGACGGGADGGGGGGAGGGGDGGGGGGGQVALTVQKSGSGSGTVSGAGIACGGTCSVSVAQGTTVTLTATPDAGSTFAGWSGCDSASGLTCTCAVRASETVTASFDRAVPDTHALTVQKSGSGSGTASGAGIACGATCSTAVADGTLVTLTAAPDASSTFVGWSGCDSTSGTTCACTMRASRTVIASFAALQPDQLALMVEKTGSGLGTISGGGVSCGAVCSVPVDRGETVSLEATPDAGSTFAGWTGCDTASGTTCTCTMSASRTVTASFAGCSVASVSVQDAVAVVNGTSTLTAVVTAGACSPSLEADWTTSGCPDARVAPSRGVTTTFYAPAAPAKCRVTATSVADPSKFDFAYVIVDTYLRSREIIPVGPAPWGITDALWSLGPGGHVVVVASTDAGTITSIDLYEASLENTWSIGSNPRGDLASGPNRDIWVTLTGEDKVARFLGTLEKYEVGSMPHGLTWDLGSSIWVANYGSDTITQLDAYTGGLVGTYSIGSWGHAPTGIAFDGSSLWVATSEAVLNLDVSGHLIRSITPVADPYGITYDQYNGYVWFSNHASNTVVRVTPSTGATASFTVGAAPLGIAQTEGPTVWVANTGDNTVSEVRASDGAIMATLKTGPMPYGVRYTGRLWVTDYGADDVRTLF
jgi:hypothetical protein